MINCLRCGMCCYLVIDDKPSDTRCPYLIILKNGKTKCKIYYRNRIKRKLGYSNHCVMRRDSIFDYDGCPYNKGNKPMVTIGCDGKHYLEVKNEK